MSSADQTGPDLVAGGRETIEQRLGFVERTLDAVRTQMGGLALRVGKLELKVAGWSAIGAVIGTAAVQAIVHFLTTN